MATLIRRADALRQINRMEERCRDAGDRHGAELMVKVFNMLMSCRVEGRVFCAGCGRTIRAKDVPEEDPDFGS